jgi:hypothetical protein
MTIRSCNFLKVKILSSAGTIQQRWCGAELPVACGDAAPRGPSSSTMTSAEKLSNTVVSAVCPQCKRKQAGQKPGDSKHGTGNGTDGTGNETDGNRERIRHNRACYRTKKGTEVGTKSSAPAVTGLTRPPSLAAQRHAHARVPTPASASGSAPRRPMRPCRDCRTWPPAPHDGGCRWRRHGFPGRSSH